MLNYDLEEGALTEPNVIVPFPHFVGGKTCLAFIGANTEMDTYNSWHSVHVCFTPLFRTADYRVRPYKC
jgi:hypothetical protein